MGMLPELGISERLNKLVTGKTPTTRHDDLFYSNVNKDSSMNNMANWPVAKADEPKSFAEMSAQYKTDLQKDAPSSLKDPAKNSSSNQDKAKKEADAKAKKAADKSKQIASEASEKRIASIKSGYDNIEGEFGAAQNSLNSSNNYISNLGKVKDEYLKSLDVYKGNTDKAISGNKTLIEQNQKKDLDVLAADTRKSMDNTNVMLGIKGATGGSASRAASRAIAESAGKERASRLTARGDQMSEQNQAEKNAKEDYETKRKQAYEWETTAREDAITQFNEQKEALERLKSSKAGYRDEDIKAESDRNLGILLSSLSNIQTQGRNFRDNLAAKITEYGGTADVLENTAVGIDAPAELDTPKFSETIDLNDPNNAEDWYDPTVTNKQRVIIGRDALGNPIYGDAPLAEEPVIA